MALTYDESNKLTNDLDFRGRIKIAALGYAEYILGEDPSVTAHNTRYNWAQTTYRQPEPMAAQLHSPVVMEPQVQAAGAAVTDPDLRTAVENVVNKTI